QRLINSDRFQTLRDRVVITLLKTVNPAEKRMRLGSGKCFNRAFVEFDGALVVVCLLGFVSFVEELIRFEVFRVVVGAHKTSPKSHPQITQILCNLRNLWINCILFLTFGLCPDALSVPRLSARLAACRSLFSQHPNRSAHAPEGVSP